MCVRVYICTCAFICMSVHVCTSVLVVLHLQLYMQDGMPDEQLILDLATELAEEFDVESLSMYDALQEVWANANKCSFGAKSNKVRVKVQT